MSQYLRWEMSLFTVLSKKEQVAEEIKKQIIEGKVLPGTKLRSVRDLASDFSVSTKIIMDAFDILENQRFIRREAGKGGFVRTNSQKDVIEVCLIAYMPAQNETKDSYFSNLAQIACPPYLRKGFNFHVRTVLADPVFDDHGFENDLKNFEQHLNADCLLVNAPSLKHRQIDSCIKLKTPVIFLGDFSEGPHPDMRFNQITGDNEKVGESAVRQIREKTNSKEITVYSGSMEHFFYRKLYDGALNEAERLGMTLHLVEFPTGICSSTPPDKRKNIFNEKISEAIHKGWTTCPALNAGIAEELLLNALSDHKCQRSFYYIEQSKHNYENYFEAIYGRIRAVISNRDDYRKIVLAPETVLKEAIIK